MSDTEFQLLRRRLENLYNELMVIEQQLHPVVTRLRMLLGEVLGVEGAPPAPAPPIEGPRMAVITPAVTPTAPEPVRPVTVVQLRSYRVHKFTVAPAPITFEGADYDLGEIYNTVILQPTVDTQIEVDKPVEPTTPVVYAGTFMNLDSVEVRRIYYKGVSPVLTGRLSVWAFKY